MSPCPTCGATTRQTKAGKNRCGTQRIQCQHCQHHHTLQPRKKGYPEATRILALKMVVDGTNFRRTARLVGVSPQTVINWVTAACDALPVRPVPTTAEVVELDELYTYVTHKKTSPMCARQ